MPFSLGPTEMIFIMVVLLLIFGAKRLPELGSGLGKGIREFRRTMRDVSSEIERHDEAEKIAPPRKAQPVAPPAESGSQSES